MNATYAGWYSFQGLDYSDHLPVIQPGASCSLRALSFNAWGNLDQTRRVLNELDLGWAAAFERGRVSGSLGYTYLTYPHREGWDATHELVTELACEAPLSPTLSVHWDVAAGSGRYWTLGLAREFSIPPGKFELNSKLHAQDHYYGMTGFPAAETGVSFSLARGNVAIQPALSHTWAWANGGFRDESAIRGGWLASVTVSKP